MMQRITSDAAPAPNPPTGATTKDERLPIDPVPVRHWGQLAVAIVVVGA